MPTEYKQADFNMTGKTKKDLVKTGPNASGFLYVVLESDKDEIVTLKEFLDKYGISYDTSMEKNTDILVGYGFAPIVFEHSIKTIIQRLSYAVHGTENNFFTEEEIETFASKYLSVWDKNTSDDVIAESFVDYWWNTDKTCRRCEECGKFMREGYCVDAGDAYYCSDDCLHMNYTEKEWAEECANNEQSYYTSWW